MKISDQNPLNELLNAYLKEPGDKANKKADTNDVNSGGVDKVEISLTSKEVQKIQEALKTVPDVDAAKVKELKEAIEKGTYNVQGEMIADAIIKKSLTDTFL